MSDNERLIMLSGGDTVYLYAVGDQNIDAMQAVLDVAYPGSDTERRTLLVNTWEQVRPMLMDEGMVIVDTRNLEETAP